MVDINMDKDGSNLEVIFRRAGPSFTAAAQSTAAQVVKSARHSGSDMPHNIYCANTGSR